MHERLRQALLVDTRTESRVERVLRDHFWRTDVARGAGSAAVVDLSEAREARGTDLR